MTDFPDFNHTLRSPITNIQHTHSSPVQGVTEESRATAAGGGLHSPVTTTTTTTTTTWLAYSRTASRLAFPRLASPHHAVPPGTHFPSPSPFSSFIILRRLAAHRLASLPLTSRVNCLRPRTALPAAYTP
ncbi:hypothetical protein E2C01_060576 [Portunus trituberculatus]|uniref:Uncharacterized protein n=1 Tax=Portunus trituberculatus TaxID=210409 RepID=A0A5B7H9E9_PORTR|nr:hypothetical protein [Portunus trituberculatus]